MSSPRIPHSPDGRRPRRSPNETGDKALEWAVRAGAGERIVGEVALEVRRIKGRRVRRAGTALGLVLFLGIAGYFGPAGPEVGSARRPTVVVSAPPSRELPDGSVVQLNGGAEIAVQFDEHVRRVVLLRGEAHFDVAKNLDRPFIVSAGGIEARAVGTAFTVQISEAAVEVLVTEGTVAVAQQVQPLPASSSLTLPSPSLAAPSGSTFAFAPAWVSLGTRVVMARASPTAAPVPVQAVSAREMDEKLSWRAPRLEFSGMPLGEALALFNRHSRVQIALGEPSLRKLELSGALRANNTDALLRLLQIEFGIRAERLSESQIVLHAR